MPSTSGLSYPTITSPTGDEVSGPRGLVTMVVNDDGMGNARGVHRPRAPGILDAWHESSQDVR
jgi:hypothetical protein